MASDALSRRQFQRESLGALLTFTLLDLVCSTDAFAESAKPITAQWLSDVNQLGLDLKDARLTQEQWQQQVEALFSKVDLPDLLRLIDFERLSKNVKFLDQGARSLGFQFAQVDGLPSKLSFGRQIFALKAGRSVVPHGHRNMATAFLILDGELRGRHYDRLADEPGYYLIRPTIDRAFAPGECSTVSDFKDNVHWFQATSPQAFILNIHVLDVSPEHSEPTGRLYLDPAGEKLADGTIRAPRLSYREATQRYG